MRKFLNVAVTWDNVTPESAEQGDAESRGFVIDGREYPIEECEGEATSEEHTAAEALREIKDRSCTDYVYVSPTGATFTSADSVTDFRTGAEMSYSVHVNGPERLVRALVKASGART